MTSRKSLFLLAWRRLRYFFEPCEITEESSDDVIPTYRLNRTILGAVVPAALFEEIRHRLPRERERIFDLMSNVAWSHARHGRSVGEILDAGAIEQENAGASLEISPQQLLRETRAHLMSAGGYRKGKRLQVARVYGRPEGFCHVLWECRDDSDVIRFSIVSRWEFWLRVRLHRLLGWSRVSKRGRS